MATPYSARRDSRGDLHRRSTFADPPISRSKRSWSNNGVQYTMETSSFSTPGFSMGTMSGRANGTLRRSATTPYRPPGSGLATGGLLGTAFGFLDGLFSSSTPPQRRVNHETARRGSRGRVLEDDDLSEDSADEDLAYGEPHRPGARPPPPGRFKPSPNGIKQDPRQATPSREPSPPRRPRSERRQGSYHAESRERSRPSARQRPDIRIDSDEEHEFQSARQPRRHSARPDNRSTDTLQVLEALVQRERREVWMFKRRLEQASRQPNVRTEDLQDLVDQIREHEISLRDATVQLNTAKEMRRPNQRQRSVSPPPRSRPRPQRRRTNPLEDRFFASAAGPGFFFETGPNVDPIFHAFFNRPSDPARPNLHPFDHIFNHMHRNASTPNFDFFPPVGGAFPNAQRKHSHFHSAGGPQFPRTPGFAPPPTHSPPANLLRPEEARRLFDTYNDRWNNLSPNDANVPFPARGLQAVALSARDSVWAPRVSASVSTWSDEMVMQANAQAFYLGVVGLVPQYLEAPGNGRVQMGFDKSIASVTQMKELVDMLKKEKTRWHSDKLGRRNAGLDGTNEELQTDERARAVFHAVCELMTIATA